MTPPPPPPPPPSLPRILDDVWDPPPSARRFPIVPAAAAGTALLVVSIVLLTIRAAASEQDGGSASASSAAGRSLWYPEDSIHSAWTFVMSPRVPSQPAAAGREPARAPRVPPPPPPPPAPPALSTPAPMSPGYLSISSKPWAVVSVDGQVIGNTPLRAIQVTAGRHELVFTHDGFETRRTWVTVQPGDTVRLTGVVLQRRTP